MAEQRFPDRQKYSILRWAGLVFDLGRPHLLHSKNILPTAKIVEKRVTVRIGTGGYHGPDLPFGKTRLPHASLRGADLHLRDRTRLVQRGLPIL